MRRKKSRKIIGIFVLCLVISITIGYALISTTLTLGGKSNVEKGEWNIHFTNIKEFEGSVSASKKASIDNPTTINYEVTLPKPGTYYAFSFDIENEGNIDAMIGKVIKSGIGENEKKYIEYRVRYDNGAELNINDLLKAKETKTVEVMLLYKDDITEEDLPKTTETLKLSLELNYVQKEDSAKEVKPKLCKRAITLHTEICNFNISTAYCSGKGYNKGDTITYGHYGVSGKLASGDAFDCDVDGDGVYDSNTERFYYVSDYYDTNTKSFNDSYATLIYYNNVKAGVPDNKATFAYDASNENWHGPVTGYVELPSTSQWSKVTLLQDTRQLLNEKGEATTGNGSHTLGTFTYTDKATRLLTLQELNKGCDINAGIGTKGELITCEYLLENTEYSGGGLSLSWWTETAHSANSNKAWIVVGNDLRMYDINTIINNQRGFRPTIDVLKTNILY